LRPFVPLALAAALLAMAATFPACRPDEPSLSGAHMGTAAVKPVPVRPFRMGRPDAVLLVTGGTSGMLEVCNCPGPMAGGMSRRSGLVHSYRAAFPQLAVLDTGNALWVEPNSIRNDYVLRAYGMVGYDALVLGNQEWAVPDERLQRILKASGVAALSSTVSSPGVTKKADVRFTWPAGKLAVVTDAREQALRFLGPGRRRQLTLAPPAQLIKQVQELRKQGFAVALVALMDEQDMPAAVQALRPDLLLWGGPQITDTKLRRVAGCPTVKVGGPEYVAAVALRFAGDKLAGVEYRAERVDETWPIDGAALRLYQAYNHEAMLQALDGPKAGGLDYVPSAECGKCHKAQYEAWTRSRHAHAYQTLVRVKRTDEPDCLTCHTSGFRTVKGFRTFAATPKLAGVNCQDCHRFNLPDHRQKTFKVPRVETGICLSCHTHVTDPSFDHKQRLACVRCPSRKRPPGPHD